MPPIIALETRPAATPSLPPTIPSHRSIQLNLAHTAGDSSATSPLAGTVNRTGTQTTLGEALPDLASVGAAGESAVGVEDGVAGLDEVGVAGLSVGGSC